MMKNLFYILGIFLILIAYLPPVNSIESADGQALNHYYSNLYIGEKRLSNYVGANDSRAYFLGESGELQFLDDRFSLKYLHEQIQPDAFDLHDFWFKKIIDKSTCPDLELGKNIDYIRYLYRLLTISYLFESLKINNKISRELGASNTICSLKFEDVFDKCSPQSEDMKKFHKRVYGKFVNDIAKINITAFTKKELSNWLLDFQHSTSLSLDPVQARLHDWCYGQKKNCKNMSEDEVKLALMSFCNDDRELIQNLCSEKDSLYGASYAERATQLLEESNAFNLLNTSGMGEDCLRRYVKIFTPKETRYFNLGKIFPLIYSKLLSDNNRYLQGELFLPGALKEFDMKGLSDFLVALKPPKTDTVVKLLPKPKSKPKPKPISVVVVQKTIETPKPEPVKMENIEVVKPKISEFEKVINEMEQKNLESLSINMESFHDDFEFTQQMISTLTEPIKKFQTRAALNDMKSYDKLGSFEAPMGLVFLKYLIDTENHQGLFNVVSVLGDKFYVNNDLEKKEKPVYIELRNDAATKNHWQIIILKKPNLAVSK